MKENAMRILRSALGDAEQCAEESEGDNILAQTAFKVGWYKSSIRTALEELER